LRTFFLNGLPFDLRENADVFPPDICKWTICEVKMVRECTTKKFVVFHVTVANMSFFVIQLSVWTNKLHTNRRTWSTLIVSEV